MAVMFNYCRKCGNSPYSPGCGNVKDPKRGFFKFWKRIPCDACGGDGIEKPKGWPDRKEMEKYRPAPPPSMGYDYEADRIARGV